MASDLVLSIPSVFRPLFDAFLHQFLLSGGRDSGKTATSVDVALIDMTAEPGYDWIVLKANYSDIRDSDFTEMASLISSSGLDSVFRVTRSPLQIERRDGMGIMYFKGADAIGSNTGRTHGLKTFHPLKGVIFSEAQQFRTADSFHEAMASVRRNFSSGGKGLCGSASVSGGWRIIVQGNPPQSPAHWYNQLAAQLREDPDWTCISPSYLDILPFLNDIDLLDIRKMRKQDPDYYDWLYCGKPGGGYGSCYPMLEKGRHLLSADEATKAFAGHRVMGIVVGADGAVDRDKDAFVPWLVMDSGILVHRSRDEFVYDPKRSGVLGSSEVCSPGGPGWAWWMGWNDAQGVYHPGLCQRYPSLIPGRSVPIFFFVDSAAPELKRCAEIYFGDRGMADVRDVKKGTIVQMEDKCRDAFGKGNAVFVDDGGYFDYRPPRSQSNPWGMPAWHKGGFPAWDEFTALRNDPGNPTKYDDTLPNDVSDAGTYGLWSWFRNEGNVIFASMK